MHCDYKINVFDMEAKATSRQVKAFEKFNTELEAFAKLTGEDYPTLYEDAYTTRRVANFHLCLNGNLMWDELDWDGKVRHESDKHFDSDDVADTLKFWRACFRRAKRYWEMDTETLDRIQDGEEDTDE